MSRRIVWIDVLFVALVVCVGCVPAVPLSGDGSPPMTAGAAQTVVVPTPPEKKTSTPEPVNTLPQALPKDPTGTSMPKEKSTALEKKLITLARQDLAKHLDIAIENIHLGGIQLINWPDASLGCPQPNVFYAQMLTPGYRIILETGGKEYSFHTDMNAQIILCDPNDQSIIRGTPGGRVDQDQ